MKDDVVVLRSYASEMEAEIARAVLDAAGIPAFIRRDDAAGMIPSLQFLRGARLLVRRGDSEVAETILEEGAPLDEQPPDDDPA